MNLGNLTAKIIKLFALLKKLSHVECLGGSGISKMKFNITLHVNSYDLTSGVMIIDCNKIL